MSPPPTSAPLPAAPSAPRRTAAQPLAERRRVPGGARRLSISLADAWLPLPDVGEVSEKLAYFARHKNEFDAVFVGSSRVYRQISPGVFDAQVTAATGRPMRSFNLGAPSMFLPESLFVIDRILAQRPARLRWMFIELDDPKPRLEEHAGLVRREVYWHGLARDGADERQHPRARAASTCSTAWPCSRTSGCFSAAAGRTWAARRSGWRRGFAPTGCGSRRRRRSGETAALGPAVDGYQPYRATLGQGKARGRREDVRSFVTAAAALKAGRAQAQSAADRPGAVALAAGGENPRVARARHRAAVRHRRR